MTKTNDVISLGNAIMDFLIEIDDNKLLEMNLNKGEMHLVEEEKAKELLKKIEAHKLAIELCPGGSAANTLRGLALLGSNVILCGKVGKDQHGEIYVEEIKKHGVNSKINNHIKQTGHAIAFITPDSERTFSVHLGAAIELETEDILEEDIAKSKILHVEGYLLEGRNKDLMVNAINLAKKHNTLVSMDLADPGVIRRNKDFLQEFIKKADILFVNEKEAEEFTGTSDYETAARKLGESCNIAIVKIGKEGSLICHNGEIIKIAGFPAQAIDTTGAGDTYAAGFLYGHCQGWNLEKSGRLGSLYASKIVEKKGVKLMELNVEGIKNQSL
ncbi:MAG: adenosine kinase [Candidatus Woesearchaeota archaeon]